MNNIVKQDLNFLIDHKTTSYEENITNTANINNDNKIQESPEPQPKPNNSIDNKNNGWNQAIDEMLLELEDKSWGYTWMHKKSVSYFAKFHDRLSITNIIFSLISGTSTFATLNNLAGILFVQVGTGIIIYSAALLAAIQHFKGYAERIEQHKQAASKYSALYHSIKRERTLRLEERTSARDYITWVTNQYDSYLLSCPDIEDDIMDQYVRQYKNDTIHNKSTTTPINRDADMSINSNLEIDRNIDQNVVQNIERNIDRNVQQDTQDISKNVETKKRRHRRKTSVDTNKDSKNSQRDEKNSNKDSSKDANKDSSKDANKVNKEKLVQNSENSVNSINSVRRGSIKVFEDTENVTRENKENSENKGNKEKIKENRERTKFDLRTPGLRCGYIVNPETKGHSVDDLEGFRQRYNRHNFDQNIFQYEMDRLNNNI